MSLFTLTLTTYNRADDVWFTIRYIVVATLFISVLWIFSKALTKKNRMSLKDKRIKVVERTLLSNDKSLILVELENIFYLLAMDKTGVHLIDKRDDLSPETFVSNTTGDKPVFLDYFKKSINKRDKDSNESE